MVLAAKDETPLEAWKATRKKVAALRLPGLPPHWFLTLKAKRSLLLLVAEYRGLKPRVRKQAFGRVLQPPITDWLKTHPKGTATTTASASAAASSSVSPVKRPKRRSGPCSFRAELLTWLKCVKPPS